VAGGTLCKGGPPMGKISQVQGQMGEDRKVFALFVFREIT
jgi:hypothetical protein